VGWEKLTKRSIHVTVSFSEEAPDYGCLLAAVSTDDEWIGFKRAKPLGTTQRTLTMELHEGTADDVERVDVEDCDM
jgi:hypothetical protein